MTKTEDCLSTAKRVGDGGSPMCTAKLISLPSCRVNCINPCRSRTVTGGAYYMYAGGIAEFPSCNRAVFLLLGENKTTATIIWRYSNVQESIDKPRF